MPVEILPTNLNAAAKGRLEKILEAIQKTYPDVIQLAFASLSEPQEEPGNDPRVDSLWIFTKTLIGEVRSPLAGGLRLNYDVAPLKDRVDYIRLDSREFDLVAAKPNSQLTLEFTTSDGLNGVLNAFGPGCDELMKVYVETLKPNFTIALETK